MTKRIHPAESARKLVGVASGVALVGIVTGFQLSANAQESEQAVGTAPVAPAAVGTPTYAAETPATEVAPEAVPAPASAPTVQQASVPEVAAPAAPAPVQAPAPAPVEPAAPVAPAAPVNGTSAGSGG